MADNGFSYSTLKQGGEGKGDNDAEGVGSS